jgi:hypothetical protein
MWHSILCVVRKETQFLLFEKPGLLEREMHIGMQMMGTQMISFTQESTPEALVLALL